LHTYLLIYLLNYLLTYLPVVSLNKMACSIIFVNKHWYCVGLVLRCWTGNQKVVGTPLSQCAVT